MTYNFKIVVQPDEDFDGHPSGWHAYCPVLERQGASTWAETEDEAIKNINELVRMVVTDNASRRSPPIKSKLPSNLAWR